MNELTIHATTEGFVVMEYRDVMRQDVMTAAQARERAAILLRMADLAEGAHASRVN